MPLPELNPGEVVADHLGLEFPGEDEWVTVWASARFGDVRTEGFSGKERSPDLVRAIRACGVPNTPIEREAGLITIKGGTR